MTALEEIQAAIEKLTALISETTTGPWEHEQGSNEVTAAFGFVGFDIYPYDAELIATLHRTIDAQLAILTHTAKIHAKYLEYGMESRWLKAVEDAGDLALARAINGKANS